MSDRKEEITRRLVRVAFDPYFMKQMFTQGKEVHLKCVEGLPENAEWVGEYFDNITCRVFFIFRHESFEPIPPHLMLPELRIVAEHCPTPLAPDGADVCHIVTHVFIDGTCAMCGFPEPRPSAGNANRWADCSTRR